MSDLTQILERIPALPPLPQTVQKLVGLLNDPNVKVDKLAEVIQCDQNITTSLLKLSNSAHFGFGGSIGSVKQAVIRLGTKNVFQMIMTATCGGLLKAANHGYDLRDGELWRHSVGTAIASELVALLSTGPAHQAVAMAYTAGLLHDVGKVVLNEFVEEHFPELMEKTEEQSISFSDAESDLLGADHAEVGARLAEQWNLPQTIVSAIRFHHRPGDALPEDVLAPVVHVADSVCLTMGVGLGGDGLNYIPDEHALEALHLTNDQFDLLCADTVAKLIQMEEWFEAL